MNLNKAFIIGRLTRDPEVRSTPNGQNVATFALATNRYWTKDGQRQEFTEYHNIVAWGKLADICSQYLKKGSMTLIEGRLQTRSWEGQDGVKRYRTEVIAENMQLGPRTGSGESNNNSNSFNSDNNEESIPTIQQDEIPPAQNSDIDVENIPF